MTSNELKTKFAEYMAIAVESKDSTKMRVLGDSYTLLFNEMADAQPTMVMAAFNLLATIEYNNYVTAEEATKIAASFVNDDKAITGNTEPSKGAHWSMEVLKNFLLQKGLYLEEKPFYNWPALWLTINMEYSDYANVMSESLGTKENERLAMIMYKMANSKLKDADRPNFIRKYYGLDNI